MEDKNHYKNCNKIELNMLSHVGGQYLYSRQRYYPLHKKQFWS